MVQINATHTIVPSKAIAHSFTLSIVIILNVIIDAISYHTLGDCQEENSRLLFCKGIIYLTCLTERA